MNTQYALYVNLVQNSCVPEIGQKQPKWTKFDAIFFRKFVPHFLIVVRMR